MTEEILQTELDEIGMWLGCIGVEQADQGYILRCLKNNDEARRRYLGMAIRYNEEHFSVATIH